MKVNARQLVLTMFVIVFTGALPASAVTYYCTPAGSGAHTGASAADAWSLSEAISKAVAGDIILLRAGNYPHLRYTRNNADWITWRADAGQAVVFTDGATFGGYGSTAAFRCRFEGVTISTNTVSTVSGAVRHCCIWGTGGTNTSTSSAGYLQFVNCELRISEVYGMGLFASDLHHVEVSGCTVRSTFPTDTDWQGTGIKFRQNSKAADLATDLAITDCDISQVRYGLSITGVRVNVARNHIHHCTSDGMLVENGFYHGRITDNEIDHIYNEMVGPNTGDHEDCIQFQESAHGDPNLSHKVPWDDIVIARNYLHHSGRQGFHSDGLDLTPPTNVVVENNLIHDTTSWDFEFQEMGSIRFARNICLGKPVRFVNAAQYEIRDNVVKWFSLGGTSVGTAAGNLYLSWNQGPGPVGNIQVPVADWERLLPVWLAWRR